MAKWIVAARHSSGPHRSYIGWYRNHPKIHMYTNEPAGKTSLVQIHEDGNRFTILAQTTAHGVFTQPPGTKGTTLFKKTFTVKTRARAMAEVAILKRVLAKRYDGLTGKHAR